MTAALPSWERISPGLQTGMLPFMAASARCRWLACTRRYLLAALQRRWLTQLQRATGRVLWGRKAQCEREGFWTPSVALPALQHLALCRGVERSCAQPFVTSLGSSRELVPLYPFAVRLCKSCSANHGRTCRDPECSVPKSFWGLSGVGHLSFCSALGLPVCLAMYFAGMRILSWRRGKGQARGM